MTAEERFARMEHITAGLVEERKKIARSIEPFGAILSAGWTNSPAEWPTSGPRFRNLRSRLDCASKEIAEASAPPTRAWKRIESLVLAIGH